MSSSWPGNALGSSRNSGGSVCGEERLGVPAQAAAPATWPRISGQKWMDKVSTGEFTLKENNAGERGGRVRSGFGQTIHAGVSGCVGFGLKTLRAGLGCNFQAR